MSLSELQHGDKSGLARTSHETPNGLTDPFPVADSVRAAQARSAIQTVSPTEQGTLQ